MVSMTDRGLAKAKVTVARLVGESSGRGGRDKEGGDNSSNEAHLL